MLQQVILNWLAKMVGGRLDGYKLKIGGSALILSALLQVVLAMFPDLQLLGTTQVDWDTTITMAMNGLAAFGVGAVGVGVTHRAYKAGLKQPCPPELCPPPTHVEIEERINDKPSETQWSGKIPGQML